MKTKIIAFAVLLAASLASAQTPGGRSAAPRLDKVFDFTNNPGQQGLQEIATILRTVADIQQLSVDSAASTVTVHGTPDELATSGWIMSMLDRPANPQATVPAGGANSQQYLVPGKSDDVIQVFHLNHVASKPPQGVQEILTVLRTVADVQKIFNYTALADLVVRGPAAQVALAEYLIDGLDVVPGSVTTSPEFHYTPTGRDSLSPAPAHEVVRVFYLTHTPTPQGVQEILTTLRTVAGIQKVFNFTPLTAMAVRGSASDVATAEWLIRSLDVPANAKPPLTGTREFNIPANVADGNAIGVYYPAHIAGRDLPSTLTLLRDNLLIGKAFLKSSPPALIYRGSADRVAEAEQLIRQKDQPMESSSAATPAR